MSEITKLYENAEIKPIAEYCKHQCNNEFDDDACIGCVHIEKVEYPPFTAEKQIELIKLLAKNDNIYITFYPSDNTYNIRYCATGFYDGSITGDKEVTKVDFKEALAGIINAIWQDLTPEEKQQVKGILE